MTPYPMSYISFLIHKKNTCLVRNAVRGNYRLHSQQNFGVEVYKIDFSKFAFSPDLDTVYSTFFKNRYAILYHSKLDIVSFWFLASHCSIFSGYVHLETSLFFIGSIHALTKLLAGKQKSGNYVFFSQVHFFPYLFVVL